MNGVLEYIEQEVGRQLVNTPIYQPAPDLVRSLMCFQALRSNKPFSYRTPDDFDKSRATRIAVSERRSRQRFVFVDPSGEPVSWL